MNLAKTILKLVDSRATLAEYRLLQHEYNLEPVFSKDLTNRYTEMFTPKADPISYFTAEPDDDTRIINAYNKSQCEDLVHNHPNIKYLIVHYNGEMPIQALSFLLESFGVNLIALQLCLNLQIGWDQIRALLVRLQQLKKLVLFRLPGFVKLPVLPKLEQLALMDFEEGDLYKILSKCGNLKRLAISHTNRTVPVEEIEKQIVEKYESSLYAVNCQGIDREMPEKVDYTASVLRRLIRAKPQLKETLRHLTLNCDSFGEVYCSIQLIDLAANFSKLRHLTLTLKPQIKLVNLMGIINMYTFPRLTHLGLNCFSEESFLENLNLNHKHVGLKYLHLTASIDFDSLPLLANIFPNLVQFEFDQSTFQCIVDKARYTALDHVPCCDDCRRPLVDILNRFPRLPRLKYLTFEEHLESTLCEDSFDESYYLDEGDGSYDLTYESDEGEEEH